MSTFFCPLPPYFQFSTAFSFVQKIFYRTISNDKADMRFYFLGMDRTLFKQLDFFYFSEVIVKSGPLTF